MSKDFIPVNEPLLCGNELAYVTEAIETGWISSEGPFVKEFEKKFSERVNREYGIAVSNGTAALDIAVKALGIGPGDEVIIPTFTIISCASAVVNAGATPILVDSCTDTWNMNISEIEAKITPQTKAIMAVHIYGLTVDMAPLLKIAQKYDLFVIEDAAEAIGQFYMDMPCGSFGDISVFSFYPNKHITTGEGGMLVTNSNSLAEKCASYRNLCFKKEQRFVHDELGWNYRMTNIQAALGLAQLEQLDHHLALKYQLGEYYRKHLSGIRGIVLPVEETHYTKNCYWVFGMTVNSVVGLNAREVMKALADNGIGTRPFFYPMHKQPVFNTMGLYMDESYPVAENLAEYGFYIPSNAGLSTTKMKYIVKTLKRYFPN